MVGIMSTQSQIESILHRIDTYQRSYLEPDIIKRFLGLRSAIYCMLSDKLHDSTPSLDLLEVTRCLKCQGTGITPPAQWIETSSKLNETRVSPNVLIDQCPVTPIDLARRVSMMHENGDLTDKKILCIGDNDLASLLIALTCKPKEIVVVEYDDRVIEFIEFEARKEKLPINVIKLDIRTIQESGYPKELVGRFDTFETDPPYTEVGMKFYAFLGMQALKRFGVGYIVIPHMNLEEWSDELMFSLQESFLQNGFVLTDVIPRAQAFQHEFEVLSTILRCKRITQKTPPNLTNLNIDRFYTIR